MSSKEKLMVAAELRAAQNAIFVMEMQRDELQLWIDKEQEKVDKILMENPDLAVEEEVDEPG